MHPKKKKKLAGFVVSCFVGVLWVVLEISTETSLSLGVLLPVGFGLVVVGLTVIYVVPGWGFELEGMLDQNYLHVEKLRDNPERIEELEDEIEKVCVIRTPSSSGGYGGGGVNAGYESFAIDTDGEAHTIAESVEWAEVEEDAKWLADQLDVPYEDETYG